MIKTARQIIVARLGRTLPAVKDMAPDERVAVSSLAKMLIRNDPPNPHPAGPASAPAHSSSLAPGSIVTTSQFTGQAIGRAIAMKHGRDGSRILDEMIAGYQAQIREPKE